MRISDAGMGNSESTQVIDGLMRGILAQGMKPVILSIFEIRAGDYIILRSDCSLHRVLAFKPIDSIFLEEIMPNKGRRWESFAWGADVAPRCAFGGRPWDYKK